MQILCSIFINVLLYVCIECVIMLNKYIYMFIINSVQWSVICLPTPIDNFSSSSSKYLFLVFLGCSSSSLLAGIYLSGSFLLRPDTRRPYSSGSCRKSGLLDPPGRRLSGTDPPPPTELLEPDESEPELDPDFDSLSDPPESELRAAP